MLRQLHSLPGLVAALLVMLLAISGAVLSVDPALERLNATGTSTGQVTVAQLAGRVASHFPGVEQIQRTASGTVVVYFNQDGQAGAEKVDPLTGESLAPYVPSALFRWIKDLHRALLLGTPGHGISGIGALFMLILSGSGALLLVRRVGGWRNLLRPLRGNFSQRWHAEVGRLALLGLMLSALSGLYLCATTFEFIADGSQLEPTFPDHISAGPASPVSSLRALQNTDLNNLRELVYPSPDNPQDVFSLRTAQGDGYVDPVSGTLLSYQAHDSMQNLYELIYRLHTGEGLWWLGLLLGLCALCVPLMSITGILMWRRRQQAGPNIRHNSPAQSADTVILVGTETNGTWGFANALHDALHQVGHRVHSAMMNQYANDYPNAQRLFILTATHGDGDAPASASQFLARLAEARLKPGLPFAVLGFGDRQFPHFCGFAHHVHAALLQAGGSPLMGLGTINRQSSQAFTHWGQALSEVLGQNLALTHIPPHPHTQQWVLAERIAYGEQMDAPTHVLRFTASQRLPDFEAGDLVGILPPGDPVPRFYSLASHSRDGVLEICVRKHKGGVCSEFLHGLRIGAPIQAFIQPNPQFRPVSSAHPVILIGAGTGIGPLAGFIRNNKAHHPMHLYWGGRNPASDFLYESELNHYLADHRLTALHAAFSRAKDRSYVQDRLISDARILRGLIAKGAQVLVCGGREMGRGVMLALDEILAPLELDVLTLKAQGRYREDVY
ncbi:PepSY domain-containing protein [Pseudomonas sp. Q12-87]|uniref:PepSY domain-containing protein n=1 Tax=Pseudomonas sp. Q12-87 TaxID=177989 RepID=UPI00069E77EB|nr:PepSY domain-containing protein [Pseudomonas sp. Q12-87]